jgi:hypothetical protein
MPASGKDLWRLPHYRSWRMTTSPRLRALCVLLRAAAYDRQWREAQGSYGGGEDHHRAFVCWSIDVATKESIKSRLLAWSIERESQNNRKKNLL